MSRQGKLAEERRVRKLYDRIPVIECKGDCHTTCGPIGIREIEQRMVAKAWVQLPIIDGETLKHVEPTPCPALTEDKKCGVYENRPMVCRVWGVSEDMPCAYGCEPTQHLTRRETIDLLRQAEGGRKLSDRELELINTRGFRISANVRMLIGKIGDVDRIKDPEVRSAAVARLGLTEWVNPGR